MNRRTMLLALAAGLVFTLYFLDAGYRRWIEEPSDQLGNQLQALQQESNDLQAEQVEGRRLAGRLDSYAARALPWDADLARSRYREWLLQLVARHEMESASVNGDAPQPVELRGRLDRRQERRIGHTIRYSLRARTSLPRLVDFFHDFERSAQLHKIQGFSLNPLGNGSELDLSLEIETLSLEASQREAELSDWQRHPDHYPPRAAFDPLAQRNIFARGFSESLAGIRLGAITQDRGGAREAWFAVGSPSKTQIVAAGDELQLPLHAVRVEAIEEERVQIAVNELSRWLQLGQTVGEVLEPSATPAGEPSAAGASAEPAEPSASEPSASEPSASDASAGPR